MGKVFINTRTGEIFETSVSNRKEPESDDWEYIGYLDYRNPYVQSPIVRSYYCKTCDKYHGYLQHNGRHGLTKRGNLEMWLTSKYGCKKAAEILGIVSCFTEIRSDNWVNMVKEHADYILRHGEQLRVLAKRISIHRIKKIIVDERDPFEVAIETL